MFKAKRTGKTIEEMNPEPHGTTNDNVSIVCLECGMENPSISNFCAECGKPIDVKKLGFMICDVCYGIYELQ
jgi:predicted amidophosphoribosyltransferase